MEGRGSEEKGNTELLAVSSTENPSFFMGDEVNIKSTFSQGYGFQTSLPGLDDQLDRSQRSCLMEPVSPLEENRGSGTEVNTESLAIICKGLANNGNAPSLPRTLSQIGVGSENNRESEAGHGKGPPNHVTGMPMSIEAMEMMPYQCGYHPATIESLSAPDQSPGYYTLPSSRRINPPLCKTETSSSSYSEVRVGQGDTIYRWRWGSVLRYNVDEASFPS